MEQLRDGVVIAGGGLAAQRCAETLRARGFEAPIRIVCAEQELPYDRPPLSKEALARTPEPEAVSFRDAAWYAGNDVELLLGRRAAALDPLARELALDDGRTLAYDDLLIATGSAPRRLPELEGFRNAHPLRTLADAQRLQPEIRPGARIVVVGAGFIGQEVASTALAAGAEATMIEALELPLAGVLGAEVGRRLVDMHREQGVRVLLSSRVVGAAGNGRVEQLELSGGERIDCDAVVVGVGVAPAAGWLAGSGLDPRGVLTDEAGRTSLPHVYAAGDVARPFDPRLCTHTRTEHWDAASRQGAAAAIAMLGDEPRPAPPPSFWSDQYGMRIQYAGHAHVADEVRLTGAPGDTGFAALYHRDGRAIAGLAVGRPREFAAMRRLLASRPEELQPTEQNEAPTEELVT